MSNYLLRAITLLALTFTTLTTFAEDWVKESDANTAQVLQEQGRFSPESTSTKTRFTDRTSGSFKASALPAVIYRYSSSTASLCKSVRPSTNAKYPGGLQSK